MTGRTVHFLRRGLLALVIGLGGMAGMAVFAPGAPVAASCNQQIVKSVAATALKNTNYSVKVSWTKNSNLCSYDHFRVQALVLTKNGGSEVSKSTTSKVYSGLTCNKSASFWVVAEKANDVNVGSNKSASAIPPCPTVGFSVSHSGNSVVVSYASSSQPPATAVQLYSPTTGITWSANASSGKYTYAGKCHTTYSFYATPYAGGQWGSKVGPKSATTADCPTHSSTGGSSGASSPAAAKSSTSASKTAPQPEVPGDFVATVQSSKVVQLNWTAVKNVPGEVSYAIDRSTDNSTWALLATTGDTSYKDSATDFAATYYYRLKAIGPDGKGSGYATAQATTESFQPSDAVITSDDKAAAVTLPVDGDSQPLDCSFDSNAAANAPVLPTDKLLLRGPYGLVCIGEDGFTVTSFSKPLKVVIKMPADKYDDFDVRQSDGETWKPVKSSYDAKKHELSFSLTAADFAAFGNKQRSVAGTIFTVLFWLLLLAVLVFAVRWLVSRRRAGRAQTAVVAAGTADILAAPAEQIRTCTHLTMAHQVQPQTAGCAECTAEGKHWKALRICLTCGHVGCSDDSSEQHARKHFETTGHPLIYEYANPAGDSIGWCYIDQTYI